MTLTKDHIAASVRNRLGVSKFESSQIVESVLETIKSSLVGGDDVLISGFGNFTVREKRCPARQEPPDRKGPEKHIAADLDSYGCGEDSLRRSC